jgi:lysozyme family protein
MPNAEEPGHPDPAESSDEPLLFESLLALEFPAPEFQKLQDEYYGLWSQMIISPSKLAEIDSYLDQIARHQDRYDAVSATTAVPWYVISVIHCLEASLSFAAHLHNGDPLTARTVNDPSGRPLSGSPPFSWQESAVDALQYDRMVGPHEWSVAGIGYLLEGYNGWGYRYFHPEINSPYLWSFSNLYSSGKYVKDNKYSATAVSDQSGAMVLLRRMVDRGLIALAGIKVS